MGQIQKSGENRSLTEDKCWDKNAQSEISIKYLTFDCFWISRRSFLRYNQNVSGRLLVSRDIDFLLNLVIQVIAFFHIWLNFHQPHWVNIMSKAPTLMYTLFASSVVLVYLLSFHRECIYQLLSKIWCRSLLMLVSMLFVLVLLIRSQGLALLEE